MKGITLLKNIQKGTVTDDNKFIYHNSNSKYNTCIVNLCEKNLYFDIFGEKIFLTTEHILDGIFIKKTSQDELYRQAIKRVCAAHHISDEEDLKSIIIALEKEIEYYRKRIKNLMDN